MAGLEVFPAISPILIYRDAAEAMRWLEKAFGFETHLVILNDKDVVFHAEMRVEGCNIMIAPSYSPKLQSPAKSEGLNTQVLSIHISSDVDAHCARARAAGAKIEQEPTDLFYGERSYKAVDLDGHMWTFAQIKKRMSNEDMAKAGNVKIRDKL